MKKIFLTFSLFLFVMSLSSQTQKEITIDLDTRYQVMDGFGASDAWCCDFLGKYWTNGRETATRMIFSQELDKNEDPKGIGLSLWRFNIGAGTATQKSIGSEVRRTECMLNEDGSYDWTKQSGQVWIIRKAKEYGLSRLVAFSNSPPIYFTKNGEGFADKNNGGFANLKEDKYDDFAEYLATVAEHFEKEWGIPIDHISPVNEPQWGWDGNAQEGSPWKNSEIAKLVRELDKSITKRNISSKIHIAEAGAWNYTTSGNSNDNGGQMYAFFDKSSPNCVGDLPSLAPVIAGHDYWSHGNNKDLKSSRIKIRDTAKYYKIMAAATEWCLLGDPPADGFPTSYEKATNLDISLLMAKIIHSDLVYANVNSWSYWTMIDLGKSTDLSRYLLMYMMNNTGAHTTPGTVGAYKQFWALGNYSLFIRPEYQRIELTGADDMATLMGSAYVAPDTSRVVAVYINMSEEEIVISPKLNSLGDCTVSKVRLYRTNSMLNLKNMRISSTYIPNTEIKIPARSITTMVYDLDNGSTSGVLPVQTESLKIYPNPITDRSFTIQFPDAMTQAPFISVRGIDGKQVFGKKGTNEQIQEFFLPQSVTNGLYMLSVDTMEKQFVSKISVCN